LKFSVAEPITKPIHRFTKAVWVQGHMAVITTEESVSTSHKMTDKGSTAQPTEEMPN